MENSPNCKCACHAGSICHAGSSKLSQQSAQSPELHPPPQGCFSATHITSSIQVPSSLLHCSLELNKPHAYPHFGLFSIQTSGPQLVHQKAVICNFLSLGDPFLLIEKSSLCGGSGFPLEICHNDHMLDCPIADDTKINVL